MVISVINIPIRTNGGHEREVAEFQPVLSNCFTIRPVTDTFADSGRPSVQETLIHTGFDSLNIDLTRINTD
jgi:hypothetical protein